MKDFLKDFFGRSFISFVIIGATNFFLSMFIQLTLYNYLPNQLNIYLFGNEIFMESFAYWASSSVAYIIASVSSFFLNRKFSFQSEEPIFKTAVKFSITIAVCYVISYAMAQPLTLMVLENTGWNAFGIATDKIAMVVGQIVFTMMNYVGQKFFAFKKK